MSISTWKADHYPWPANEALTPLAAVIHALRKWWGFLPENLAKHGITFQELWAEGMVGAKSCALCLLFNGPSVCRTDSLGECPLRLVRGGTRCFLYSPDVDRERSPYSLQLGHNDPTEMIAWLEKAFDKVTVEEC